MDRFDEAVEWLTSEAKNFVRVGKLETGDWHPLELILMRRLRIEWLRVSKRGALYEATYSGQLICISHQPLLDGARALLRLGLTGWLEMRDDQKPWPRMRSAVETAARHTVVEGPKTDIRIAKWKAPDDRLRGLSKQRRNCAAATSGASNPETASDGLTAEAET